MSLWNDNSRIVLIDQVQQREYLWDCAHPDYNSKCRKAMGVMEITDLLNRSFFPDSEEPKYTGEYDDLKEEVDSADEVRNQWKNLKDTFKRKQRWIHEGKYARDPHEEPTWKFFRLLKFLEKQPGGTSMVENEEDSCPFPTSNGSGQNSGASEDVALSLFPTCFRSMKRSPSASPPPTPSNAGTTSKAVPVSSANTTETIHPAAPPPTSTAFETTDPHPPRVHHRDDEGPEKKRWKSNTTTTSSAPTSSTSGTVDDEFSWFGVGVAAALRRISADSRVAGLRLQKAINDLIFEAELARLES